MKALLWKELRQLALWTALMFLAMTAAMLGSLYSEHEKYYFSLYRQAWFQVWLVIGFGAPCVAFVIGLLQTVLEVRRDQWAFLLHRGLSPTQIFLAKTIAGLGSYAVVTLVPAAAGFFWCTRGGIERQPLTWHHALPLLASLLTCVAFYFAALLVVVWRGPWYFSRLLPVASPVLLLIGVVGYASEVTEYVPLRMFLAIALAVGILGTAAWGVFVRSGEAAHRPALATCSLGVPLYVAMFGLCIGAFALAGLCYEWLDRRFTIVEPWRARSHTHFTVNRDGHFLRIVTTPDGDSRSWERKYVSIHDEDDPQSQRYAPLVGQSLKVANKLPDWDPLPMISVHGPRSDEPAFLKPQDTPRHILEDVAGRNYVSVPGVYWVYSSADGWIYGYLEDGELSGGRIQWQPPRLVAVAGPDGFTTETGRPQRRFGRLLAKSAREWNEAAYRAWHEFGRPVGKAVQDCLLFDDGLYLLDAPNRTVKLLLAPPEGHKIRSLLRTEDQIAVVYDDLISVHKPSSVAMASGVDPQTGAPNELAVDVPAEMLYSFPIPGEISMFPWYHFGKLPDRDSIIFEATRGISTFDLDRFFEMRLDGTVVRRRDYVDTDVPAEAIVILSGLVTFAPSGPVLAAIAFDEGRQAALDVPPGACARLFRGRPLGMLLPAALLICQSLLCGWSAGRTARRYGFTRRTRRAWQWTAALLGPAALLTLWFLRDWPVFEKCPSCAARRPVDQDDCPRCRTRAAPPPMNGTEILLHEPVEEFAAAVNV